MIIVITAIFIIRPTIPMIIVIITQHKMSLAEFLTSTFYYFFITDDDDDDDTLS